VPFTAGADNADVRADSHHLPLVAAAGVLLFQPDHITEIDFQHLLFNHLPFLRRQESILFGWIPTFVGKE